MIILKKNIVRFAKNSLQSIVLLAALSACGQTKPKQADFLVKYGGDPYMGTVKVNIVKPDGTTAKTERGEGNAHFEDKGKGQAQMVLFGAIRDKKGDAGFAVDGHYKGLTWKNDGKDIVLELDANGKFSGGGELKTQKYAFSGTMSGEDLDIVIRITEKEKTAGGYPAGTTFVFNYNLSRRKTGVAKTGTATKKKCKKIVWKTRYIGHFDGSGSTVRVPVCMD